jgi:hypothetical protein
MSDDDRDRLSGQGPVILALVALLALLSWTLGSPPSEPQKPKREVQPASPSQLHVTLADFRRIERGMSLGQVEDIFGVRGEMQSCGEGECSWMWRQGPDYVEVSFREDNGKATCGYFHSSADKKEHWLPRDE